MTAICSNCISQRAVKAWIIANCIDFVILVFKLNLFYHIDGFQSEKSQKPYDAFFLGHPVVQVYRDLWTWFSVQLG